MPRDGRIAVDGELVFPPLVHKFKTGAVGDQGVGPLRASIRGRLAYHNVCLKHDDIIKNERARRAADGLPTDCPDLEADAHAAKKDVLNSRKVRKPLKRNEATTLRGMMGSENYALFKKTLELEEDYNADNTPAAEPPELRRLREENQKAIKPRVDSLAQWFLVYGEPSAQMPPGMLSNFAAAPKKCCGERSQVVNCHKGRLTRAGAVTDYNRD